MWALVAIPAVMLALAILAPAAHASGDCGGPVAQPFAGWQDSGNYFLAPGGSFDDGASGWDLGDGAQVVSPDVAAPGPSGGTALSIPSGASATSAPICVDSSSRLSRMFAMSDGGGPLARLRVEVLADGDARLAGPLGGDSDWSPTRRFTTFAPSGSSQAWIRYRLTAVGGADWLVDDLYVDPRANH